MGFPDTEEKLVKSLTTTSNPIRTLCEVLREIWDKSLEMNDETLRDEIQARLKEAFMMAKKMDRKLKQYKHDWWDGVYQKNENYEKNITIRQDR